MRQPDVVDVAEEGRGRVVRARVQSFRHPIVRLHGCYIISLDEGFYYFMASWKDAKSRHILEKWRE
jgi:hypothetical protein